MLLAEISLFAVPMLRWMLVKRVGQMVCILHLGIIYSKIAPILAHLTFFSRKFVVLELNI